MTVFVKYLPEVLEMKLKVLLSLVKVGYHLNYATSWP